MVIKTYICRDIRCENCAQKIREALADAPVQGVDVLIDQQAVRVGLFDEKDDEMVKECLADVGFPPSEVLAETHEDLATDS